MTIKEFRMKRTIMSLMIKIWTKKATKIFSFRAGKITAISSSEITQPKKISVKAKRKSKNFQALKKKISVKKITKKGKSPSKKLNNNSPSEESETSVLKV